MAVSQFLVAQQFWLQLGGGTFLIYLGIVTLGEAFMQQSYFAENIPQEACPDPAFGASLLTAYGSTLLLTLTNPITILSFAAIFAGVGMAATNWFDSGLLVMGVFSGSACWWLLLCSGVSLLRRHITTDQLRWISGGSAGILLVFGISAIANLFS